MSIVILEAMAAGKAILATDVGENIYVIKEAQNGLLIKPGEIEKMTGLLNELINDKERRDKLGSKARQDYEKYYNVQKMLEEYENLYTELLEK
jgi:glycosyltransferase involved in cell wall biosynthesis